MRRDGGWGQPPGSALGRQGGRLAERMRKPERVGGGAARHFEHEESFGQRECYRAAGRQRRGFLARKRPSCLGQPPKPPARRLEGVGRERYLIILENKNQKCDFCWQKIRAVHEPAPGRTTAPLRTEGQWKAIFTIHKLKYTFRQYYPMPRAS